MATAVFAYEKLPRLSKWVRVEFLFLTSISLPFLASACTHRAEQRAIVGSDLQDQVAVSLQLGFKFKLEPDDLLHYSFS